MSLFSTSGLLPFTNYQNSSGQFILSTASLPTWSTATSIQPATTTTTTNASGVSTTVVGGNVSITLSDSSSVIIFNSVADGLTCLQFMHSNGLYYLQLSESIMLINIGGAKMLIVETTFINQKLLNSYHFCYIRGKVRACHRNLSTIKTLTQALESVGYQLTGTAFTNNYSLQTALTVTTQPNIQIFDLNYVSNPTNTTSGSVLEDANPIVYVDATSSVTMSVPIATS
jgi:hypothetical protein